MALRFYNTLTKKKEAFRPLHPGTVRMYNCGPTVYNYAHIGNFRSYLFADVLRRYLEWKGLTVKQIMNITDVGHMTVDDTLEGGGEDKIEKTAAAQGRTPKEIADFYMMAFFEDIVTLNIRKAFLYPRASEHVPQMQEIIAKLIDKGHAYTRDGHVYFEVGTFPAYGKLSGNTLKQLQAGKRIAVRDEKKSPFDFALWISNPKHLLQWDSPWGRGYPGWHIECSAMGTAYLGEQMDIHTGGEDNIFPHHDCEIAQSEGSTGKRFVKTWMHARHLLVDGKKMSKSLGNFYTLRDLLTKGYQPREIRYLLISAHYRTRLNFTEAGLLSARESLRRLDQLIAHLRSTKGGKDTTETGKLIAQTRKDFEAALDDDLNMAEALSAVFACVTETHRLLTEKKLSSEGAKQVMMLLFELDDVLGLQLDQVEKWSTVVDAPEDIRTLLTEREQARKAKDFARADRVRAELKKLGIVLEDSPEGVKWKRA